MNLLNPDEFAARLPGVSAWWVRRELAAGRIRGSKIGRRWFIPEDALTELVQINSNREAPRKRRQRNIAGDAA
jgi:hypothetical protein